MIDGNGEWYPNITPKQIEILNCDKRYLLLAGPRKTGKTIGNLHKIAKHLWVTPTCRVGIFNISIPNAKGGGVWDDLLNDIMPEWIENMPGMEYTTFDGNGKPGAKTDVQSKSAYFKVKNFYGKESECRLFSLNNEMDIEAKLKSARFSMIYFPELSNFHSREVLAKSVPQLRMIGLPFHQHQWIADTNPAEEGEESWIYKVWYQERVDPTPKEPEIVKELELIEVGWNDNPYLTEMDRAEIRYHCNYDEILYDRYVKGLWVAGGMRERIFRNTWRPEVHIIGNAEETDETKWEVIQPSENCIELCTGWDLGNVNSAAVLLEKVNPNMPQFYFTILDEQAWIKENMPLDDFVLEFLPRMDLLEKMLGKKVSWNHWSDDQALKQYKSSIGGVDALVVRNASQGRIELVGAPKENGSVEKRVNLVKRLLVKNKLFVSANCKQTIEMFRELRRGNKPGEFIARTGDKYKHIFDAISYAIQMETINELFENIHPQSEPRSAVIYAGVL